MNYTYRVVTKGSDGEYRINDFVSVSELLRRYIQIGTDDCSLHQDVRGCPVLKGLIGPIFETGDVLRYEVPEVFEQLTRDWAKVLRKRRKRQIPSASIKPPNEI